MVFGHVIAGAGLFLLVLNRLGSKWDDPVANSQAFKIGLGMFGIGETLAWGIYTLGSW